MNNPTLTAQNTVSLEGHNKINVLLLKFTFNNASRVPPGIPEKVRGSDFNVDQKHAAATTDKSLAHFGAVRAGRVDTGGKPVIDIKNGVCVRMLRKNLRNTGACPKAAHWFPKLDGKAVVVLEYVLPGHELFGKIEPSDFPADTLEGIRDLARKGWQYCQVYVNSPEATGKDNGTITVNLGGLLPETALVKSMLEIESHHMMAAPFAEPTE